MRARAEVAQAEKEVAAAKLRESDAFWNPNPFVKPGEPGRQADEAKRQKEIADKARGNYEDLRREQLGIAQQEERDLVRRDQIERGRRDDRMAAINRWRDGAMATALRPTHFQEDYIRRWGPRDEEAQGRQEIENFNTSFATTAQAFGMPLYTPKQAEGFASSKGAEVTRELEAAFTDLQQMIRRVRARNAELEAEVGKVKTANSQ